MKKFMVFTALIFLLLAGTARAQGEPSLKTIMVNLEADMEAIVRGLNYGDFEAIETRARAIADHDKPPMQERAKILTFLGDQADDFKKSDAFVHDTAVKVANGAAEKDYEKVVEGYGILLGGCVACHTKYRSRIVEHLKEGQ